MSRAGSRSRVNCPPNESRITAGSVARSGWIGASYLHRYQLQWGRQAALRCSASLLWHPQSWFDSPLTRRPCRTVALQPVYPKTRRGFNVAPGLCSPCLAPGHACSAFGRPARRQSRKPGRIPHRDAQPTEQQRCNPAQVFRCTNRKVQTLSPLGRPITSLASAPTLACK